MPNGLLSAQTFTTPTREMLGSGPQLPVPPEMAYFTALETGYYQVNARASIQVPNTPGSIDPFSYVSIAIYTGPAPGATTSKAIGNNLQIGILGPDFQPWPLIHNNAPNVSDVVYLLAGQILSIWFWQSALVPLPIIQGSDQVYVSIHKVS